MKGLTTHDKHRLVLIDALRCFAALWVVLFHLSAGGHLPTLRAEMPGWLHYIVFDAGHLGVPIFFVLSGIVMAATTRDVPMNTADAARFVLRRLVRLVPPYYVAIAVGILFNAVLGQRKTEIPSVTDVLGHMVFLQGFLGIDDIIEAFWTLCIEVQFYITFAMLLWLAHQVDGDKSFPTRRAFIWASALLALLWPTGLVHATGWQGGFIGGWFSFMAGVLCGMSLSGARQNRCIAMGYCAVILLIGVVRENSFSMTVGLTGLLFCSLINRSSAPGFLASYPVQKLGLVSYSLYLFHSPVTGTFMYGFRLFFPTSMTSDVVAAILAVMTCVACAGIAYLLVERPAIAWTRRIKPRRPKAIVL